MAGFIHFKSWKLVSLWKAKIQMSGLSVWLDSALLYIMSMGVCTDLDVQINLHCFGEQNSPMLLCLTKSL